MKITMSVISTILVLASFSLAATVDVAVDQDATARETTAYANTVYNTDWGSSAGQSPNRDFFYLKATGLMGALSGVTAIDVVSAKLWVYKTNAYANQQVLYLVTQPWDESTLTWNTKPGHTGGYGIPNDYVSVTNAGWNALDVLGQVRAWLNGSFANNGVDLVTWTYLMDFKYNTSENITADSFSPFGTRGPFFQLKVAQAGNVPMLGTNPETDAQGNTWAVYGVDDSALNQSFQNFNNYSLMNFHSGTYSDFWLGTTNRWNHPSYGQNEMRVLTSLATDSAPKSVYPGAMTFTPAQAGKYSLKGFIQVSDWDTYNGYNNTLLTFAKFDSAGKWNEFFNVTVAHNAWFEADAVDQLQGIYLGTNEKLVLLVRSPGTTGIIGTANLSKLTLEKLTISNCDDVTAFGYSLKGDLDGDCEVGLNDLKMMAGDWLK